MDDAFEAEPEQLTDGESVSVGPTVGSWSWVDCTVQGVAGLGKAGKASLFDSIGRTPFFDKPRKSHPLRVQNRRAQALPHGVELLLDLLGRGE